ncbi:MULTISPECIES: Hpt domain-containing protein [unclassified Carboxylicivirga]|uniref:Hpt domain-containing protein n=1 Tax=Carboxylicivirga TaxID=1628153 RepID=UPI003D34CF46
MDVKHIFIHETRNNLAVLEQALIDGKELSDEVVEQVIRTMHTLRGTAPMVGYDELAQLAAPIECVYKRTPGNKDFLGADVVEQTLNALKVLLLLLDKEQSHKPDVREQQKVLIEFFNTISG